MSGNRKYQLVTESPIGPLGVKLANGYLCGLDFLDRRSSIFAAEATLAQEVQRQLLNYFQGQSTGFSLPLVLHGTEFQRRVWQALSRIERGAVRTYGEVARELNSSPRAVGNACRSNPVPLIIPCHRVVAASGIGGFAGATAGRRLEIKRWLLQHEGVCL
jgi:methylated-DNA-[protein]-cysteine S-methyltransferase